MKPVKIMLVIVIVLIIGVIAVQFFYKKKDNGSDYQLPEVAPEAKTIDPILTKSI